MGAVMRSAAGVLALLLAGCGPAGPLLSMPLFGYKTSPGPLSEWGAKLITDAHLELTPSPDDPIPGRLSLEPRKGPGHVLYAWTVWNSCSFCTEPTEEELLIDLPLRLIEG